MSKQQKERLDIQVAFDVERAEQQFVGYTHGKQGYSIESLADSMGLTPEEWAILRDDISGYLPVGDTEALDEHFKHFEG